jgi:hypothetical protein
VNPEALVPMRWPCGPLAVERARNRAGFTAAQAEALGTWAEPRALEILAGTPVSCLVVPWAAGSAADAGHQDALAGLVASARSRGLEIVGHVEVGADLRAAARAAATAGLSALATESGDEVEGVPVLRFRPRESGSLAPTDFLGAADAVWPGMKIPAGGEVDAWSGPTGPPWIDSNAWFVRLVRALVRPKALWLSFDPPESDAPIPPESYVMAIADSTIYGARWVLSLDPHLRLGLLEGRPSARTAWATIAGALAFFEDHAAWRRFRAVGQLAVVSDYSGPNQFLSFEVLNLLARQSSLYHILETSRALVASLTDLKAVLYVDEAPPDPDLVRRLYDFAEQGGTLITPPGWELRGEPDDDSWLPRFRISRYGHGRLAVSREPLVDPQVLAEDAHLLMSYRYDPVRVFNAFTGVLHYLKSGDGDTGVLHLLRYSTRFLAMPITAWFEKPWASGRTWRVGGEAAMPTERVVVESGVEFHVPAASVYSALEVSS